MKLGSDIKQAIESLALEKGVTVESMYEALVSALGQLICVYLELLKKLGLH